MYDNLNYSYRSYSYGRVLCFSATPVVSIMQRQLFDALFSMMGFTLQGYTFITHMPG